MINSQRKGKLGERAFAHLVNKCMGYTEAEGVRRTPCSGALSSFKGDLIQTSGVLSKFHFEVKNEAKARLWAYIRQAEEDASALKIPLVAIKRPQTDKFYVVMDAEYFFNLLKSYENKSCDQENKSEDTQ